MSELRAIISKEEERAKANKLPSWVKCMECGERPRADDFLIDLIANGPGQQSNALIHQTCAAKQGKVAGLNIGGGK